MADDKYQHWYANNKDSHNEKRRTRYDTDPEYRERVKTQARESARLRRANNQKGLTRTLDGKVYTVLKMGDVVEYSGLTAPQIRNLHSTGAIPECSFTGAHRVYTQHQADLLKKYFEEGSEVLPYIKNNWGIA